MTIYSFGIFHDTIFNFLTLQPCFSLNIILFYILFFYKIEEWPIWRTRTPVVIALRHHHGHFERHRYRYMVVTPGAEASEYNQEEKEEGGADEGGNDAMNVDTIQGYGLGACTTGNDNNVGTQVMAWEDPFREANVS